MTMLSLVSAADFEERPKTKMKKKNNKIKV